MNHDIVHRTRFFLSRGLFFFLFLISIFATSYEHEDLKKFKSDDVPLRIPGGYSIDLCGPPFLHV